MSRPSTVLLTGGAGYIGTHTCVALLEAGHRVIVVDDLSNSTETSLERVRGIVDGDLRLPPGRPARRRRPRPRSSPAPASTA